MQVDNIQKQYNFSREAASRLLKASIRTLDRYIKSKKLSSQVIGGRIWLNKEEIDDFKQEKVRGVTIDKVDMSTSKMSIDSRVDKVDDDMDNVDNSEVIEQEPVNILSTQKRKIDPGNEIYKKLYTELKEELNIKQERLEIANYRVGQLECQVRNSVPMLEYHKENYEKKRTEETLKTQIEESTTFIKTLSLKLKYAQFNKRIFLILLLVILALQPLWLLFLFTPYE